MPNNKQSSSDRGFASMDDEQQREIARKGGESVSDEDRSFSQDRELASEAGRKGGQQSGGNTSGNRQQRGEQGRGKRRNRNEAARRTSNPARSASLAAISLTTRSALQRLVVKLAARNHYRGTGIRFLSPSLVNSTKPEAYRRAPKTTFTTIEALVPSSSRSGRNPRTREGDRYRERSPFCDPI